ncbi:hypothetical protein [Thiolapillus sp.]
MKEIRKKVETLLNRTDTRPEKTGRAINELAREIMIQVSGVQDVEKLAKMLPTMAIPADSPMQESVQIAALAVVLHSRAVMEHDDNDQMERCSRDARLLLDRMQRLLDHLSPIQEQPPTKKAARAVKRFGQLRASRACSSEHRGV